MRRSAMTLGVLLLLALSPARAADTVAPTPEKNTEEAPAAAPPTAGPVDAPPESPELKALIDGVAGHYDKVRHIRMDFTQVLQRKAHKRTKKATGTIEFARPGRMRWEYLRPDKVTYVADGETLWAWQPEDNLVYRSRIEGSRMYHALRFLFGVGDLREAFTASTGPAHSPDTAFLVLVPKTGQQDYKELSLVVDRESFEIRESFLTDPMDNVTHYIFSKQDYVTPIADERFRFTPPPGATVQDI